MATAFFGWGSWFDDPDPFPLRRFRDADAKSGKREKCTKKVQWKKEENVNMNGNRSCWPKNESIVSQINRNNRKLYFSADPRIVFSVVMLWSYYWSQWCHYYYHSSLPPHWWCRFPISSASPWCQTIGNFMQKKGTIGEKNQ